MSRLFEMKNWGSWTAALALGLAMAGPAAAQLAQGSDAPVDITADELEVVNAQCLATYKGAAEALQDNVRLRADILKIYYKPTTPGASSGGRSGTGANCGSDLDRMEATGSVYFVRPDLRAKGDAATYNASGDTIVMTGQVIAVQGQNVLQGSRLVINLTTNDAQMQSSVTGRNKPGRVRTVIYPKQQPAGQAAAPR